MNKKHDSIVLKNLFRNSFLVNISARLNCYCYYLLTKPIDIKIFMEKLLLNQVNESNFYTLIMLYRLKNPPDCPLSRCSRIVACISSSTARNSLSSGSRSTSNVPGFGDCPNPIIHSNL